MKQFFAAFFAATMLISGSQVLAASSPFEATSITDNILLVSGPDGNTVVGVDGDNLVLVDGVAAENAQDYLDFVYGETGVDNVSALYNTHWHPEHIGLNAILGNQGVKIIAHDNTRQWLASTIRKRGDEIIHTPTPAKALPNDTFYTTISMPYAGATVNSGYLLQAHTDGDIYVFFPEENVLVTGGVVSSDDWVVMDIVTGGFLGGMLDAYELLLNVVNDDTVIVPVSGPVMSKAELQKQYEMYKEIMVSMVVLLQESQSVADVVAADPTAGLRPDWGSPDRFLDQGFRSFYGHLRNGRHMGVMP